MLVTLVRLDISGGGCAVGLVREVVLGVWTLSKVWLWGPKASAHGVHCLTLEWSEARGRDIHLL